MTKKTPNNLPSGSTIIDISQPISPATPVFPGDTGFSAEWILRMEDGGSCNVSTMRMSTHLGTHTDSPRHFDPDGIGMHAADLSLYIGRCRVVRIDGRGDPPLIPAAALEPAVLAGAERILFKTREVSEHTRFDPSFTAVGPEAAAVLVAANIHLIGIDTPSMDHATSEDLPAHHALTAGGVAILENLDLTDVACGDYELIALPLKIVDSDSSPVRAVLRRLPRSRQL